jgi:hypothetical protein
MERAQLADLLQTTAECHLMDDVPEGPPVVVGERDPVRFMRAFAAAVAGERPVFLADPDWGAAERATLDQAARFQISDFKSPRQRAWLAVPTGGSSGAIRFARHDQDTIAAAVGGFTRHFGVERVNAVGVLPLHHVSGLMAWMRCALTGGAYRPWSWDDLAAGQRPALEPGDWFLSLVPTQLQRLLVSPGAVEWLRRFRVIALGGGPVWPELAEAAARTRLPISLGYGMTETAAMVAAQRPGEFLAGDRSAGRAMPHAVIGLDPEGVVTVSGESVSRGYWPERPAPSVGPARRGDYHGRRKSAACGGGGGAAGDGRVFRCGGHRGARSRLGRDGGCPAPGRPVAGGSRDHGGAAHGARALQATEALHRGGRLAAQCAGQGESRPAARGGAVRGRRGVGRQFRGRSPRVAGVSCLGAPASGLLSRRSEFSVC